MAITEAQRNGLQGLPTAQVIKRMSLGEWLALNRGELGKDAAKFALTPDIPVFVLAIRGHVVYRGPGLPRPGQTAPDEYNNITLALDARNGNIMGVVTKHPGFSMPVPVP